jgi:serralysin
LIYNGALVALGELGSWTPIPAEQTASGYEVAWQVPGTDQYALWNTDSSGNYQSTTGVVSGSSPALGMALSLITETAETSAGSVPLCMSPRSFCYS